MLMYSLAIRITPVLLLVVRNKESSQTTLEAETDEVRSKDLRMQVIVNEEINGA